jgi:uncharacterized membrane protein YcaP (DUF421 family)
MEILHAFVGTQGDDITWWQMSLRATLIFVLGLLMVRFASTRAFGKWSALDIILAVVVGSNLSRAMTGSAPFAPTIIATTILLGLHAALAGASARWSWLSTLTKGSSVALVKDGVPDEEAMRHAGIGKGDLRMAIRAAGLEDLEDVQSAALERNGDINIVER